MSFPGIAIEQREKEVKALKPIIACCLIGSLALHVGVLASGIGNLLRQVPEIENEPVEVTFVDPPTPQETQPPPPPKAIEPPPPPPPPPPKQIQPPPPPKPAVVDTSKIPTPEDFKENKNPGGSQGIRGGREGGFSGPPKSTAPIPPKPIAPVAPPPPIPKISTPKIEQPKPVEPAPQKPVVQPPKNITTPPQTIPEPKPLQPEPLASTPPIPEPEPLQKDSDELQKLLGDTREATAIPTPRSIPSSTPSPVIPTNRTPKSFASSTPSPAIPTNRTQRTIPSSSSTGAASSNRTSRGVIASSSTGGTNNLGTNQGSAGGGNLTAQGTGSPGNGFGRGTGDGVGDGDGSAACRRDGCNREYPEWAKPQRIEGKVVVAVDADPQGNITNVQLVSSTTGSDRFDKKYLEEVRTWKLKPSKNGYKGKIMAIDISLKNKR